MKKSLIVLLSAIIAVNVSGCKKSSDKMRENTDSSKILQRLKTIKMFKQNLLPKAIIQKKPIRQILTTG